MNQDKIEIHGSWRPIEDTNNLLLDVKIMLNGQFVKWSHIDIYCLTLYYLDHRPKWCPGGEWSSFELFSCSCGVAGCAGIGDGIYVKVRKNSVEWRAAKEDGYGFLGKSFFSFDRKQYEKAFGNFLFWLESETNYDNKLCVDLGHYDGDETTVEQFFNWLEETK